MRVVIKRNGFFGKIVYGGNVYPVEKEIEMSKSVYKKLKEVYKIEIVEKKSGIEEKENEKENKQTEEEGKEDGNTYR